MFDLEKAIAAWRHPFTHARTIRAADLDEMERHLRDHVADLVADGLGEEAAFEAAVAEMGGLPEAEPEYEKVHWRKARHQGQVGYEVGVRWGLLVNYVRLAYRNLLRNRVPTVLNVVGLSIAVGCTVVVYAFLDRSLTMDRFHPDGERVFLIEHVIDRDGRRQTWGETPHPLGPALAADFPQVEQFARVEQGRATMEAAGLVFAEGVRFADPAFLAIFHFPLRYGDPEALRENDAVVLSHRLSRKYFGDRNPVGEPITLTFGEQRQAYTVRGVAAPFPPTASFDFNLLLPYERLRGLGLDDPDDWGARTAATFVKLRSADDLPRVADGMGRYRELNNAVSEDWPIAAFAFDDLYSLSLNSHRVRGDISGGPAPFGLVLMSLIAVFMLALACFNYMNVAIATAQRRVKEIGMRKVMGSTRAQLVVQFLSENVLLCLFSLIVGVVLAAALFMPGFNALFAEGEARMALDAGAGRFWLFLVGLLIVLGLASGAYPAFYIARFQPAALFRSVPTHGSRRWFTRVFLTAQFVLTFITMIAGVLFYQNAAYQQQQSWGYSQEHVVVVQTPEEGQYRVLAQEAQQVPGVLSVAGAVHQPGRGEGFGVVDVAGEKVEAHWFGVGHGFFGTLGIRLAAGRFFVPGWGADATAAVVNEAFVQRQGWGAAEALGRSVRFDSTTYAIVGVATDFHYEDFTDAIEPALFLLADEDDHRYLSARVQPGAGAATAEALRTIWKRSFPGEPVDVSFQDEVFDYFYRDNRNVARLFGAIALMALLIACMGLFGLAAQNVNRRMREVSIRRVLGASALQVFARVNRGFFALLAVAALVATPLAYAALDALLAEVYAYRPALGPAPFAIACALIFGTALLTVASLIVRVVRAHPAEVLRTT